MADFERVYPPGRLATIIVWLLDRLPTATRAQVLGSYWSADECRAIARRARRWDRLFRGNDGA